MALFFSYCAQIILREAHSGNFVSVQAETPEWTVQTDSPENKNSREYRCVCLSASLQLQLVAAPQTLTRDSRMDALSQVSMCVRCSLSKSAWFLPCSPQFQFHMTVLHLLNFLQCIVQKYPGDTNDIRYVDTVRKNTYDPASSQCGYPLPPRCPAAIYSAETPPASHSAASAAEHTYHSFEFPPAQTAQSVNSNIPAAEHLPFLLTSSPIVRKIFFISCFYRPDLLHVFVHFSMIKLQMFLYFLLIFQMLFQLQPSLAAISGRTAACPGMQL